VALALCGSFRFSTLFECFNGTFCDNYFVLVPRISLRFYPANELSNEVYPQCSFFWKVSLPRTNHRHLVTGTEVLLEPLHFHYHLSVVLGLPSRNLTCHRKRVSADYCEQGFSSECSFDSGVAQSCNLAKLFQ